MQRIFILFICLLVVACSGQSKEELLQEGNALRDQGNYRGAIVLYKNALEKDANFLEARKALAESYLKSGRFDKAENEFKKVQHQNPSDGEILLKLAEVYINNKNPQTALLELDKFHSENPETAASLVLYGRAHGASGDLSSAEKLFKRALAKDPQSNDARLNLARVYLQRKDDANARHVLQEIIELDKDFVQAYYMLASLESRAGAHETALAVYQSLLQVKPKELQALYMIGVLQLDQGDLDAAQKTVDTFLARFNDRPEGQRLKGLLLYRQGKFEPAVEAFTASLKNQQHILAYFFLGLSHFSLEQFELALNQFQKSLDINPDFLRARVLVAMTLLKQKRVDDAIIEIEKVLRKDPNNAYARNILGSALLAQGKYDEGMAELEAATELDPSLADAHLKKGVFNLAKGKGEEGEADLIKAVAAAPEVLNSRLLLVTHYLRQKNYPAAIDALKEGMNGSPSDALLNNYLAAAYFSQKNSELAIQALETAKKVNPDYLTPYFNLASYYASESQYAKALAEYQAVLGRDSENLRALLGMAALYQVQDKKAELAGLYRQIEAIGTEEGFAASSSYYLKQKDPEQALAVLDRGLLKFPNSAPLLERKGALHRSLQQPAKAESAYLKLSAIAPEAGNRALIGLYLQSGQLIKAKEVAAQALQSEPQKAYPYLLSAVVSLAEKNIDNAVEALQKGIDTVEKPVQLQMQLAAVYERAEKSIQAESIYQRLIKEMPRFAPAYTALGFARERNGDKGEALELYRSAIKYDPKNIAALNNAAYLLVDNFGQAKEALEYAMGAYRLQPADPRIMDTLGYVLLKNKRYEDAQNLLEKAAELLPDIATVKLHLAMAQKETGKKQAAVELLNQVVASGTKDDVRLAKKLLKSL